MRLIVNINTCKHNWTVLQVHGNVNERDRILSDPAVANGSCDIYLTTYETFQSEEAFFTENVLFHTITIDEGHRLKNDQASLAKALSRLVVPFRLLLTGTPMQNNLHELWALLNYILPGLLSCKLFDNAANLAASEVNRDVVAQARTLLETVMVRRLKSEVEDSLMVKKSYNFLFDKL